MAPGMPHWAENINNAWAQLSADQRRLFEARAQALQVRLCASRPPKTCWISCLLPGFHVQAEVISYQAKYVEYTRLAISLGRRPDPSLSPMAGALATASAEGGRETSPGAGGAGRGRGRVGRPPGPGRGRVGRPPGPGRGRGRPPLSPMQNPSERPTGEKRPLPAEGGADASADGSEPAAKRERAANDGGGAGGGETSVAAAAAVDSRVAMSMDDMPAEVPVVCNGIKGVMVLAAMRVRGCACSECSARPGPPESRPLFHPTHWEQHCGEGLE